MRKPFLPLLGLALAALAVVPVSAQDEVVFGTREGLVMVMVNAQFSDELDERIWHLPLGTLAVQEDGLVAMTLDGADVPTLHLPRAEGQTPDDVVALVQGAVGHLLQLEYHPAMPANRGRIHASWTLSSEKSLVAEGLVPLSNRLYSKVLSYAPADLPDTGIFAMIADAQNRYTAFVDHVERDDAHATDEYLNAFMTAVDDAGASLGFYRQSDGRRVTQEHLDALVAKGHVRSADLYWREAVEKFDTMEPVNAILNNFVAEFERLPEGTVIVGPYPGVDEERTVDIAVIDEFRRAAARRFLAEAVLCAEAENPWLMNDNLEKFRTELAAAGVVGQHIDPNDFVPETYPTIEEFEAHLAKKASGRLNLWERILAYFQTLRSNDSDYASPAGNSN